MPAVAAPGKKPSFGLGVLGAAVGTVVGAAVYFCVFYFLDVRFKLLAVGVGYLAGLGAEIFGRKEGSKELGVIAATMALAGLVGVQYCVVRLWWNADSGSEPQTYEQALAEAKRTMQAMPTGSDQEIRVFLATEWAEEGENPTKLEINAITREDIQEFRESELPGLRDLAGGKVSREEWEKDNAIDPQNVAEDMAAEEGTFKAVFLLFLLSKFNLISMAAAAGLAYKACANA